MYGTVFVHNKKQNSGEPYKCLKFTFFLEFDENKIRKIKYNVFPTYITYTYPSFFFLFAFEAGNSTFLGGLTLM